MKRTLLLLAAFFTLCIQLTLAQGKKALTGTVRNAAGDAIPGVTITEKGTANGTISGADGSFRINAAPRAILVFNFIGYLKQEITVGESAVTTSA